jgi:hypothetical protein
VGVLKEGLTAEWFDPRSGHRGPAKAMAPETYRAPEEEDWVLLLQKK